jgi:hypothetical protein
MVAIVIDGVCRFHPSGRPGEILAGIQVPIEAREIAAGYFHPQAVTRKENITGCPEINRELIDLARVHELGFFERVPIARPDNSVRQVLGKSVWPNVNKLGREIGIDG